MKKNRSLLLLTILILSMLFAGCSGPKNVTGEITEFVSEYDAGTARLVGVNITLDNGDEVFLDMDNIIYDTAESTITWHYVYANDHSAVVSDIVCGEDTSILFTMQDGREIVFEVGSVVDLTLNEDGEYQLN